MFTPPASPAPPRTLRGHSPSPSPSEGDGGSPQYLLVPRSPSPSPLPKRSSSLTLQSTPRRPATKEQEQYAASVAAKRRVARRAKWLIILVPAVLVLITLSTRYLSHPPLLDIFTNDQHLDSWEIWSTTLTDLKLHKRHPSPDSDGQASTESVGPTSTLSQLILQSPTTSSSSLSSQSAAFTTPASSGSGSGSGSQAQPGAPAAPANQSQSQSQSQNIPTIPATPPPLPTPFPQPLDQTMNQNYSTVSCQNFFTNMTQQESFRSCRPFSLLLQSSDAFIQAQQNLTELNVIIWGTCNTDTSDATCDTNMAWFTDNLPSQCAEDLSAQNAIVQSTLIGLQAYILLRKVACLADQTTNSYCYIDAVHNSNPADVYFYSLPLGTQLPDNVTPSCSACTQSVMALYAQDGSNLTALNQVYDGAAAVANKACGAGYVQITAVSRAARGVAAGSGWVLSGLVGLLAALSVW